MLENSRVTACSVLLLMLSVAAVLHAFQGMASPSRTPRSIDVKTSLPPIRVNFRDVAEEAGLTAVNVSGGKDRKKYILEATGSGVGIFDFDNDGLMDVILVNGTTLDGERAGGETSKHLDRNLGEVKFEDVTEKDGISHTGWGQGV